MEMESYTTKLHNSDISIYSIEKIKEVDQNKEFDSAYIDDLNIFWNFGVDEAREYGIKSFTLNVTKIIIQCVISYFIDDDIEPLHTTLFLDESNCIFETNLESINLSNGFYPTSIEIDFSTAPYKATITW